MEQKIRTITDKDIKNYEAMVEMYLNNYVRKKWNEASLARDRGDVPLGNSGFTMNDMRQQLKMEVCIALQKYNPNYITESGRSVKESTFVYQHLFNRVGQLMKRLTKKRYGYGIWTSNLEEVLWEVDSE
jgi:hypothetical protein